MLMGCSLDAAETVVDERERENQHDVGESEIQPTDH
jgi:hypothetical protein